MTPIDMEIGCASVGFVGHHGAYAKAHQTLDACEPTQDAALAEVEKQLTEALADVRALRKALAER